MANVVRAEHYRALGMWQKMMSFVTDVYQVTNTFPNECERGLSDDMRKLAALTPNTVTNTCGPCSDHDFITRMKLAEQSIETLRHHIQTSHILNYLGSGDFNRLSDSLTEITAMLKIIARNRYAGTGRV